MKYPLGSRKKRFLLLMNIQKGNYLKEGVPIAMRVVP
jgi:hypothetical protein